MKYRLYCYLFAMAGLLRTFAFAADAPAVSPPAVVAQATSAAGDANQELTALQKEILTRLQKGLKTEQDFADELGKFDQLLTEHQGDKSDAVAQILLSKAALYLQVFQDYDKAQAALHQVAQQFPNTPSAAEATQALPELEQMVAAEAIQKTLAVGTQFPDFSVPDLEGKALSVSSFQGKIVLIDFWATWCGPCMEEMPNVIAAYQKFHDQGFDVIGVSLDKKDQHDALVAFLKKNNMPWRQYYNGKDDSNLLADKYGVISIPQNYLLDGSGKIIAIELRGPDLAPAIEKALAANASGKNKTYLYAGVLLITVLLVLFALLMRKKPKTLSA